MSGNLICFDDLCSSAYHHKGSAVCNEEPETDEGLHTENTVIIIKTLGYDFNCKTQHHATTTKEREISTSNKD